ncbi:cytoskeleton organization protein (Dec1) [Diplocarpon rosae]|nr:cytoskeleton organization protein (Dec1) [Diplocarpon rosae]
MDQFQDRQDAQIWNAIEAKNFKQALKLVDKRLAKKHTEYHEALRIYIRALSPQVSEKSAVLLHLEELAEKKTVLADLVVLDLYDDSLEEVLPEPGEHWAEIIGELRWQSVKASPKNEETSTNCFQRCLARNDLDHARQIANSLEKSFPKNRNYIFWNISTMFLFSIQPKCPEMQKKIWGGLALGQMGKLANATKQALDQKQLSIRSIQSPQELLLLQRVTQTYGKPEQCLEYLRDPLLGPESVAAKGEWELWRIKLGLTEKVQQWKELFETTGSLLKRSRTADSSGKYVEARLSDWIVWDAYIRSSTELNENKFASQVEKECQAHLDTACGIDKSWKRNASLALVTIAFKASTPFSESVQKNGDMSYRVTTILKYLQEYANASTAYNDVKHFVGQLSQDEREQLLEVLEKGVLFEKASEYQSLATARQITESINTTKLRYLIRCSLPENERNAQWPENMRVRSRFRCISCSNPCGTSCCSCLEAITKEAISSYRIAIKDDGLITRDLLPTDRHPADDFAILAAISLIKLALSYSDNSCEPLKMSRTSYLLQATALLESAWMHSKSNFQISLVLVRLYVYLGCGSLAVRAFQRLALKQVQLDTLSYTLFDRISSFHPHPFTHTPDGLALFRTPIEQLRKHQKLYKNAQEHVAKSVWLSFKHNSYNSVFEIKEVDDKLSRSLARVMSAVEGKKVARLVEPKRPLAEISQEFDILPDESLVEPGVEDTEALFADTNDVETFPNFESPAGPRFEKICRFMPGPSVSLLSLARTFTAETTKDTRYRLSLSTEKLLLIIDPSVSSSGEASILQQWLKQHTASQDQVSSSTAGGKDLTQSEVLAQSTYDALSLIISTACDKPLWTQPDVKDLLDGYNKDLINSLEKHLVFADQMESIVPAFQSTLHALYTAHEVGTMAIKFCSYISRRGKDVYEKQSDANKTVAAAGQKLLQVVAAKCAAVKKGLDEGGWIDKVLGSVLPDGSDEMNEVSVDIVAALRKLVDENFMEEWAGEIVESWKDSVVGFSLLKKPPTA